MSEHVSKNTAFLVIDMQQALLTGAYRETEVVDVVNALSHRVRAAGAPVFFIQHNHSSFAPMMQGAAGWQIHASMDRQPTDQLLEKTASDSFYRTDLEERLRALSVRELIVTGLQTEFCVDATCRAALSRDFDVVLVADGHTTGNSHLPAQTIIEHHNNTLANIAHPSARLRVLRADEISVEKC